ncbi:MAG: type II and III secretion system protein family protein, partial [Desulfobacterales bacterium]|nr:type II and III secretion system protein family protein [Desulfobacterales bacterium]
MAFLTRYGKIKSVALVFILALLIFPTISLASDAIELQTLEPQKLTLVSGKSIVLRSAAPVSRVSVAAPEVADFLILSANEIYITGKAAGSTNLTLWQNKKLVAIFDLEVGYDLSRLKQEMHEILPEEEALQVISTNDSITLSGKISSAANLSQAVALVKSYAPEGKVNNFVEVGGVHQVMLEVRVAEMGRSLTRRLGINFAGQKGDQFGVSLLGNLAQLQDAIVGVNPLLASSAVNALFRFDTGDVTWTGIIDALKEDGLVKILAEPTLITLSGKSANFLAGGEFPVPVPQGLGTVGIEYKPFGVGLVFTPTVLNKEKISIQVTPEVSELDFSTAVRIEGFVTPGISTRRASTTVELGDGQSFAIAGLLRETVLINVQKFPILGDIPILGALFQSKSFQRRKSELVIIVTPHLVK